MKLHKGFLAKSPLVYTKKKYGESLEMTLLEKLFCYKEVILFIKKKLIKV